MFRLLIPAGISFRREGFDEFMATPRNVTAPDAPPLTLSALYKSRQWHPLTGHDLSAAVHANYTSETYPTPAQRAAGAQCRCGPLWTDPCRLEFRKSFMASMASQNVDVVAYPTWISRPLWVGDPGDDYFDGNASPMVAPHVGAPAITVPMGYARE